MSVIQATGASASTLREELAGLYKGQIESIRRASEIVKDLDAQGEDLSEFPRAWVNMLRRIANGQALAECYMRFYDKPKLSERVALLPIPDQRKLAAGDLVDVVVHSNSPDAKYDTRRMRLEDLAGPQLTQVICDGRLLTKQEQIAILDRRDKATNIENGKTPVTVRLELDVIAALTRKAKRAKRTLTGEISTALARWVEGNL